MQREIDRLLACRHHDPFVVLGRHRDGAGEVVRVYLPNARDVHLIEIDAPLIRHPESALFEWRGAAGRLPPRYRIRWLDAAGTEHREFDPYCFPPQLPEREIEHFTRGEHHHAQRLLGAHAHSADAVSGVLFATWAPNAERVSVVGDFNAWDGRRHPMRVRASSGVWELFVPGVAPGALYKFEMRNRERGEVVLKSDPYGRYFEQRPATAARVTEESSYAWGDAEWLERRRQADWQHARLAAYEVHLGSWRRTADGGFPGYDELGEALVPHVAGLGFSHVELLPVTEHPLDASWGYQTTGYFAPTSRFGTPDEFRCFVDRCHQQGIGVILDWVPGHFPKDAHALARFDGSALYEHDDPRRGEHREWGTLIFNYGRNEVRSFLISSALYWIEEFHIDALRVDAVASMLYLDYSREPGDWLPNRYGGNENLEAIDFLRELNGVVQGGVPGTLMIAEESTAWPQVTRPPWLGGLGFAMKWNMGWMHDTLEYFSKDPVHRRYQHDQLTFGLLYSHSENFVLPFSHDEVVHGKRALLAKMPGDEWQRFANLRLLYAYLYTYPGKKLLFMGAEHGEWREWDHQGALDWGLAESPPHRGIGMLLRDLNRLYRERPALHRYDFESRGFEWIDCHDAEQSVLSYLRRGDNDEWLIVCLNFTPVPRQGYRIGVPGPGRYREVLNTDSAAYGGSNLGNLGAVESEPLPWMGRPCSVVLTLPPLAAVVLEVEA